MRILLCAIYFLLFNATVKASEPATPKSEPKTRNVLAKKPLGLDLMAGNTKGVTIYPNPANDHIIISSAHKANGKNEFTLSNSMGQRILKMDNLTENTFLLDVSGLQKGIYFIEVISGSKVSRTKWIKQ